MPARPSGDKIANVRQHTSSSLDLYRAQPAPRRACEKEKNEKKKKEYAENVHSRDSRRA
jgi:hypothetical protein